MIVALSRILEISKLERAAALAYHSEIDGKALDAVDPYLCNVKLEAWREAANRLAACVAVGRGPLELLLTMLRAPPAPIDDDDLAELLSDAVGDDEGRLTPGTLRRHLAKRGAAIVEVPR